MLSLHSTWITWENKHRTLHRYLKCCIHLSFTSLRWSEQILYDGENAWKLLKLLLYIQITTLLWWSCFLSEENRLFNSLFWSLRRVSLSNVRPSVLNTNSLPPWLIFQGMQLQPFKDLKLTQQNWYALMPLNGRLRSFATRERHLSLLRFSDC